MKPILECHGLSKQYNRMSYALQNLNLALEPGQIVGLLGPNGSGKTTLIKLINDLLVPTEGRILIDGRAPGVETKKIVSYLPERSCLDESMRIKEIFIRISPRRRPMPCSGIWRSTLPTAFVPCPREAGRKCSLCWS